MHPRPSRFLSEIPLERLHQVRSQQNLAASGLTALASRSQSADDSGFRTGQQVMHQKFGQGVIIDTEGNGSHARVHVNFKHAGSKWLVLAYAKLETL